MRRKRYGFWQVPGTSVPKAGPQRTPIDRWLHIELAFLLMVSGLVFGAMIMVEDDAVPSHLDSREVVNSASLEYTYESNSVREENISFGGGPPSDMLSAAANKGY